MGDVDAGVDHADDDVARADGRVPCEVGVDVGIGRPGRAADRLAGVPQAPEQREVRVVRGGERGALDVRLGVVVATNGVLRAPIGEFCLGIDRSASRNAHRSPRSPTHEGGSAHRVRGPGGACLRGGEPAGRASGRRTASRRRGAASGAARARLVRRPGRRDRGARHAGGRPCAAEPGRHRGRRDRGARDAHGARLARPAAAPGARRHGRDARMGRRGGAVPSRPARASRRGSFDGAAGPHFAAALLRFQSRAGLAADGVAGPATLARLARPPGPSPMRLRAPDRGARPATGSGHVRAASTPASTSPRRSARR